MSHLKFPATGQGGHRSGISLVVAAGAMRATFIMDPSPYDNRPGPHLVGLCFLGYGVNSLGKARSGRGL
jgi:hypothetical protein